MDVQSIAIVGTGLIGSSWAAFYASQGFDVRMYDVDRSMCQNGYEKAMDYIELLRNEGFIAEETALEGRAKLEICEDLDGALQNVQLVQESASETYEVKRQLYKALDAGTGQEVVLASSSSGLLMTEIQKVTRYPERCLVAHPFNPPHLVPLVELVPGNQTGENIIFEMKAFYEGLGKIPVVLKKEAPGHIANRLAAALWREAIDIVLKGIASVEDVDKALFAGPGLRWALMGQHLIYHLGGGEGGMENFVKHFVPGIESWWKDISTWTSLPPEAKTVLLEGVKEEMRGKTLAEVTQWRDEKLIKLLKVIYA